MMEKKFLILFVILPSLLFIGCSTNSLKVKADGGVFRSLDRGLTFEQKNKIDENTNISNINISDIAINEKNPDIVYLGTLGSGMFKSEDGGETWKQLFSGSIVHRVVIDPSSDATIYIAVTVRKRGKIFKTTDNGTNWEEIYSEARSGFDILSLNIDPKNSSRLFAGDSQGVIFRSFDFGKRWRVVNKEKSPISIIKVGQNDSEKVYYVSGGTIFGSSDGGESFQSLNLSSIGRNVDITSLEIDPQDANVVYVSAGQNIFKSVDAGQNFFQINTLNPKGPIVSNVAVNQNNSDEWYYGSGFAVYKTSDNGVSWSVAQLNSNRRVKLIKINPANANTIYLGMERVERKRAI